MRCSKAKLIAVLLIFSVIVGLELYLSRSKGAGQSAGQFSNEWRSVEKPHETWISGKKRHNQQSLSLQSLYVFF